MLAGPGGAAAVAGDRDTDGLRWRKRAEVEVDPRSPAALIPLAEHRDSIILQLFFICLFSAPLRSGNWRLSPVPSVLLLMNRLSYEFFLVDTRFRFV